MKSVIRRILDLLSFRPCIICGGGVDVKQEISVCKKCYPVLNRLGVTGTTAGNVFVSPLPYKDNIRKSMQHFKFNNKKYYGYSFATITYNRLKTFPWAADIDCIACVPMRSRVRLYNQCAVMAEYLSQYMGVPFKETALSKVKDLPPFYTLSKEQRLMHIKGAFAVVDEEYFKDKKVLLLDDIYTTGATMNECARVIRGSGAEKVYCVAVCNGENVK